MGKRMGLRERARQPATVTVAPLAKMYEGRGFHPLDPTQDSFRRLLITEVILVNPATGEQQASIQIDFYHMADAREAAAFYAGAQETVLDFALSGEVAKSWE